MTSPSNPQQPSVTQTDNSDGYEDANLQSAQAENEDYANGDNLLSTQDDLAAQPSKFKVKMTSPSPDVVIATVEPEIEAVASSSDELNAGLDTSLDTSLDTELNDVIDINAEDNSHTTVDSTLNSPLAKNGADDISSNSPANGPSNSPLLAATDRKKSNAALESESIASMESAEQDEEEEVKEVKEAKLESYKQFIARQFSDQKIDYPEVRVTIEANALPSKMYFVMNVLSAIIASYGLVTNSAAVVIGAMLVAMMLGPITGVALAIIDYRMPLLRKSLITVLLGISLVVLVGFVVGWLHKDQALTAEILSRTQPTSMDLMIALAGGTAGAYAMVSPHLSVAVVGVAVATALVPPLAASGILFANGEMQLGLGALLLAITNIIAIQFTNALVLWFLGFRRLVDDDYKSNTYLTFLRRNAVTLLLLVGLGIYLTINLNTNAKQQTFENNVKDSINSYFIDKGNVLTNTQFDKANGYQTIRAVIRGETTPSSYDVRQIEATITQNMADNFPDYLPIKLQLRYLPVQVIESDPLIADQLDKTDAAILSN